MQKSSERTAVILRCNFSKINKHIVVSNVSALLNSDGGQFVIQCDDKAASDKEIDKKMRTIEQWIEVLLGKMFMFVKIKFNVTLQEICIYVEKFHDLVTVDYKMFLPSPTQICKISGQSLVLAREAVFAKNSSTTTRYDLPSVQESFIYGSKIPMLESYEVQFKQLKSESTKSTSLADRLVGNKLLETISAFANYGGGAIYVGVDDDSREIHGERVTTKEKEKIVEKVTEKINKMVWFSLQTKPSYGVHWDIYFRAVVDERGKLMESTYVIVIVVARCTGGVSVGEPESYHIVNDVVTRMDLKTWRERFFQKESLVMDHGIDRPNWSSERNRNLFHCMNGRLIRSINAGSWDAFGGGKKKLELENSNCNMTKFVVISNEITAHYKLGRFDLVENGIKDYESLLSKSTVDANIHEARLYLLKSCIQRCRGNIKKSYEEADKGLTIVDQLPPGIVVGEYYCNLVSVITILLQYETEPRQRHNLTEKSTTFSRIAIKNLDDAEYCNLSKFDQKQKAHINLAFLLLQSSFMVCTKPEIHVSSQDLEQANESLNTVNKLINEGYPLTDYRECQYHLARSMLFYRRSQNADSQEMERLRNEAVRFAKKAEGLATNCKFKSLMECSRQHLNMFHLYPVR
ncbi:uncharacterized protein LOC124451438 [Xenia sp. Carnegie-2017]|uniref:uncharacterized protein LOC124451438 n=1 Tax=Xenia sp. Carnegie-2017 TaxID=2897299 RepID=UPI001F046A1D|nr:uncharacterized protein LOC124451438 [Xenia sp. Carnegie-2017]